MKLQGEGERNVNREKKEKRGNNIGPQKD